MSNAFIRFQRALPHHAVSRLAGRFAGSQVGWIKDRLIRSFIATYDVDMSQAARPVEAYGSFNDFFTRELSPGVRPLADAGEEVLCPADGEISQIGRITDGRLLQAKGRDFTAAQLLGGDARIARRFAGGSFATIYLSPRDYHRVHMPAAGELLGTVYVPGDLFSVNRVTADHVDGLFARNERLACLFDGPHGAFASVMVGAMIVAGIETVWGGREEAHGRRLRHRSFADDEQVLAAGDEMGRFFLGSTVILLFEPGQLEWNAELAAGDSVQMGQSLGRWVQPKASA